MEALELARWQKGMVFTDDPVADQFAG